MKLKDLMAMQKERMNQMRAEIGDVPNWPNIMMEPRPKNDVPSLKKRKRVPTDEELDTMREGMPRHEADRRVSMMRRIGKSGGLQTW